MEYCYQLITIVGLAVPYGNVVFDFDVVCILTSALSAIWLTAIIIKGKTEWSPIGTAFSTDAGFALVLTR